MGAGVKVAVAPLNVDDKANVAEEARFGCDIKSEESDPAFVDFTCVLQVRPETCSA